MPMVKEYFESINKLTMVWQSKLSAYNNSSIIIDFSIKNCAPDSFVTEPNSPYIITLFIF